MSNIIFLFQKLLIKQNHKTGSFFCVQYLYHDDISIYQFLIENIKFIFLSDFGQKIPLLSVGLKILKNMCWPQLSLLPIISQSLGKNLHKYMQNLKLIIKVKAKTPDMNIDKITKHKMDAKWQNFNHSYTKYNKKLQPLWSSEVFTLALLDFLSEKLSNTKNPQLKYSINIHLRLKT